MSTMVLEYPRTASPESYARFGPKLKTTVPGPNARKIVAHDAQSAINQVQSLINQYTK